MELDGVDDCGVVSEGAGRFEFGVVGGVVFDVPVVTLVRTPHAAWESPTIIGPCCPHCQ